MSAELNRGIKALHLSLDTPVDAITGKVRNDLSGIKVWCSLTSGFTPDDTNLVFNGLSLDITISNLSSNKEYFVRYAFISAIDPTVFTLSPEMYQTTYDEGTTIYGRLTNPSSIVPTESDGTGGDYSVAGGTFKVYEYSQEVTSTDVVYGAMLDTVVGGINLTIDPTTGVYTVLGLEENYGSVVLTAVYKTVAIELLLVVTKAIAGSTAKLLKINADGNAFVYKDVNASVADTTQVTISGVLQNAEGTVDFTASAYNSTGAYLGNVTLNTTATNTVVLTRENFNPTVYTNTVAYVVVVAQFELLTDTVTIYRINNGTEQITVELSNESHTIPANFDGSTVASSYIGSGTTIKVREGSTYLQVDNSAPYLDGTWTVTSTASVGITVDTTPGVFTEYINYDTHSNMTQDAAYIDYTISGKTHTGKVFTIVKRQSFAKSTAGIPGQTAALVTLTATQLAFIKFKDGTNNLNSITISSTIQNIVSPVYSWKVNGIEVSPTDPEIIDGGTKFALARPSTFGAHSVTVTVSSSVAGSTMTASDTMSVVYLEEGSDAINFLFKDPNIVVSANALGIVENNITSITNHIVGVRGMDLLTPGVNVTYTIDSTENCTAHIGSIYQTWNQQFTITGAIFSDISLKNAKVVIKCSVTIGGSTVEALQTCYIAKVSKGDTGAAAIFVDLISEADVVASLTDGTGYSLPTGNAIRLYSGGTITTAGVTYGGTATKNGLTVTVGTDGTFTLSGSNWSTSQEVFNITATLASATYVAAYTIAKSKAGGDAILIDLLSENEVVNAAADGTGYSLPTGNALRLFKGGSQIATGVTYGGTTTKNGLTLTISSTTGDITLSGAAWTTDRESFILSATYNSVVYTYTYKITKAKQGIAGISTSSALLTATDLVFIKYKNGTYNLSSITITSNIQNVPNPVYVWKLNGSVISGATSSSYVFARPSVTGPYNISISVTSSTNVGLAAVTDTVPLLYLEESSSALNFMFKDLNLALSTDSSGVATIGSYTNHIVGVRGADLLLPNTDVTYSIASYENCTASLGSVVGYNQQFSITGSVFSNAAVSSGKVVINCTVAGTTVQQTCTITKPVKGNNGTNGTKTSSGTVYYTGSVYQGTPSASTYTFSTGTFSGLSSGWSTSPTFDSSQTYNFASTFTVSEVTSGGVGLGYGTPSFTSPVNSVVFTGLVTFTNFSSTFGTQITTIDGGKITTGTLSVDKITAGSSNYNISSSTFGFGTGTVVSGLSTVGFFKTYNSSYLALGALSSSGPAFVAVGASGSTTGGFSNNAYGIDNLSPYGVRTSAGFCTDSKAAFFQLRSYGSYAANTMSEDSGTQVFAKFAYNDGLGPTGAQISNRTYNYGGTIGYGNGSDFFGVEAYGGGYYTRLCTTNSSMGGGTRGLETNAKVWIGSTLSVSDTIYCNSIDGIRSMTYPLRMRTLFNDSQFTYAASFDNGSVGAGGQFTALSVRQINSPSTHWGVYTTSNIFANGSISGDNIGGNTVTAGSGGATFGSSRRYKEQIEPINIGLEFILGLDPVNYVAKSTQKHRVGFIAEDFPDDRFVARKEIDGVDMIDALDYVSLVAPLTKAVQELNAKVEALTAEIEQLRSS